MATDGCVPKIAAIRHMKSRTYHKEEMKAFRILHKIFYQGYMDFPLVKSKRGLRTFSFQEYCMRVCRACWHIVWYSKFLRVFCYKGRRAEYKKNVVCPYLLETSDETYKIYGADAGASIWVCLYGAGRLGPGSGRILHLHPLSHIKEPLERFGWCSLTFQRFLF